MIHRKVSMTNVDLTRKIFTVWFHFSNSNIDGNNREFIITTYTTTFTLIIITVFGLNQKILNWRNSQSKKNSSQQPSTSSSSQSKRIIFTFIISFIVHKQSITITQSWENSSWIEIITRIIFRWKFESSCEFLTLSEI